MAGVLIIVSIPRKDYEIKIKNIDKSLNNTKENSNINEKKENKRSVEANCFDKSYGQDDIDKSVSTLSKCKSTDSLHSFDKEPGIARSKSEITVIEMALPDVTNDTSGRVKSSWNEIRRAVKPRQKFKKLTVKESLKGVDILSAFDWDTPLEVILSELIRHLDIKNATWISTKDDKFWQVTFSLYSDSLCEELLQVLQAFGIGVKLQSSLSVIPCLLYKRNPGEDHPTPESKMLQQRSHNEHEWTQLSNRARSHLNMVKLLRDIKSSMELTGDWLLFLFASSLITAVALVENSDITLFAGFLLAPLFGPISAVILGTVSYDRAFRRRGLMLAISAVFLCLIVGFMCGLTFYTFIDHLAFRDWITDQILTRSELRSLWVGAVVATLSGAGVALAIFHPYRGLSSLAGVSISASLLPPVVNAGLLFAVALLSVTKEARFADTEIVTIDHRENQSIRLAVLGTVSLCVGLVNLACINLAGLVVYKIKDKCRMTQNNLSTFYVKKILPEKKQSTNYTNDATLLNYEQTYNEVDDKSLQKKKLPGHEQIQSDTVTYRRHTPAIRRLRAQNIEDYCLRKATLGENHSNLQSTSSDKDHKEKRNNLDILQDFAEKENGYGTEEYYKKITTPLDFAKRFNIYGLPNTKGQMNRHDKLDGPILEPSISYTVDSNKYTPFLDNKSFNV